MASSTEEKAARDEPGKHVAAQFVGAERIIGSADRPQPPGHAALVGIGETQMGRKQSRKDDQQDHDGTTDAHGIVQEAPADRCPVAARLVNLRNAYKVVCNRAHGH
jgi:hypothetical protein